MKYYQHQQLDNPGSQIRILTLRRGTRNEPLSCSLENVALENAPPYEALSYHWGSKDNKPTIVLQQGLDSLPFPVTKNLFQALQRIRQPWADRQIWTDAICIDQNNVPEKNKQIILMTKIYSLARKVLIYLGEQDEYSAGAISLINRITAAIAATPPTSSIRPLQWIRNNNLPVVTEPWIWTPLKEFLRRDWFRRKWIIQEAAVASDAIIILGEWLADWSDLEKLVDAIYRYGLAVLDHTTYTEARKSEELQQGLAQLHRLVQTKRDRRSNKKAPLLELLYKYQTARAENRNDHLYALLGLAGDLDGIQHWIDCGVPVVEIVEHYARQFLARDNNLQVLYYAGLHSHYLMAPSWVCRSFETF